MKLPHKKKKKTKQNAASGGHPLASPRLSSLLSLTSSLSPLPARACGKCAQRSSCHNDNKSPRAVRWTTPILKLQTTKKGSKEARKEGMEERREKGNKGGRNDITKEKNKAKGRNEGTRNDENWKDSSSTPPFSCSSITQHHWATPLRSTHFYAAAGSSPPPPSAFASPSPSAAPASRSVPEGAVVSPSPLPSPSPSTASLASGSTSSSSTFSGPKDTTHDAFWMTFFFSSSPGDKHWRMFPAAISALCSSDICSRSSGRLDAQHVRGRAAATQRLVSTGNGDGVGWLVGWLVGAGCEETQIEGGGGRRFIILYSFSNSDGWATTPLKLAKVPIMSRVNLTRLHDTTVLPWQPQRKLPPSTGA